MTTEMPIPEWSPEEPANGDVEIICIEAGKQAGVHFDVCTPKTFRVQRLYHIVDGTNYLVKVKVSEDDKFLHVMIFYEVLPCRGKLSVTGVRYPKTISDPLVPF